MSFWKVKYLKRMHTCTCVAGDAKPVNVYDTNNQTLGVIEIEYKCVYEHF